MEKIEIKNLTFTYPEKNSPALTNIFMEVNRGEFTVIFGKSGSGKSTLLKLFKPILAPNGKKSGNIFFDDSETLSLKEQAEKIGFVMQNPDSQIVCDKVWHELAFGLENLSVSQNEIRARVAETASFFGIQNWFYKSTSELSGGEKQLLNLASVMVQRPELLILDEPTSSLDPIASYDFFKILEKINKELGTTIIISEHHLDEVFPIADKVIALDDGKILACEKPELISKLLKNHDLFHSLPSPCKIFCMADNNENTPITVKDGHDRLSKMPLKKVDFSTELSPSGDKIISLKDIWFRYEKNSPDILKGFSLDIFRGEFYAITGGNGTGKTTALSVISEINTPYRGHIIRNGKFSVLPQNPQTLFSEKTVKLNLISALSHGTEEKQIYEIVDFCEIEHLLDSHPFDLSGGEMQKVALAMVLLTKPDILIMDEPTKGLDTYFKTKFGELLTSLKNNGITIIMVSHDIEFCAKYADRCGMFFAGKIISQDTTRNFFTKNNFYTTTSARMSKDIIPGAISEDDIFAALGIESFKVPHEKFSSSYRSEKKEIQVSKRTNKLFGILYSLAFAFSIALSSKNIILQILSLILLWLACINFIPQKEFSASNTKPQPSAEKKNSLSFIPLLAVPITILSGMYFLDDRKYYFISLLVILEICLAFIIRTEHKKPSARELVLLASLTAIAVTGRCAFAMLPQFKPVTALIIITGMTLGGEFGFLVGALTGFVSNFFFGQGPWTPWQMFAWGIIGLLSGLLFENGYIRKTKLNISVFGFISVIAIYGIIMNTASVLIINPHPTFKMLAASYAAGFPFDIVHALSTVFFLWFAGKPIYDKIERIKLKHKIFTKF